MKFVFKSKIPALVDAGIYFFKFLQRLIVIWGYYNINLLQEKFEKNISIVNRLFYFNKVQKNIDKIIIIYKIYKNNYINEYTMDGLTFYKLIHILKEK